MSEAKSDHFNSKSAEILAMEIRKKLQEKK